MLHSEVIIIIHLVHSAAWIRGNEILQLIEKFWIYIVRSYASSYILLIQHRKHRIGGVDTRKKEEYPECIRSIRMEKERERERERQLDPEIQYDTNGDNSWNFN